MMQDQERGYGPQGGQYGTHHQQQGHGGPSPQARSQFQWVPATNGSIPPNAVQGGREKDGKPLYIARQWYKGGLHPGKAAPHLDGFYMCYDSKEIQLKEYFVLCGPAKALQWIEVNGRVEPNGALWTPVTECHEADGKPLYIAKTRYDGGEQLGKAGPHLDSYMCFPFGDKERDAKHYYVLAYV
ncbi:hypothetical protein H4R35_003242 [Dimargaris xerosporica]|nr:hypothetical protein H4R35_003242 [Dimargaris xerosporica]